MKSLLIIATLLIAITAQAGTDTKSKMAYTTQTYTYTIKTSRFIIGDFIGEPIAHPTVAGALTFRFPYLQVLNSKGKVEKTKYFLNSSSIRRADRDTVRGFCAILGMTAEKKEREKPGYSVNWVSPTMAPVDFHQSLKKHQRIEFHADGSVNRITDWMYLSTYISESTQTRLLTDITCYPDMR